MKDPWCRNKIQKLLRVAENVNREQLKEISQHVGDKTRMHDQLIVRSEKLYVTLAKILALRLTGLPHMAQS